MTDFLYLPFIDKNNDIFIIIPVRTIDKFTGWECHKDETRIQQLSFLNEINAKQYIKIYKVIPTDHISEDVMRFFIKRAMDNGYPQS